MVGRGASLKPDGHLKHISILIACAVLLTVAVIGLQFYANRQDIHSATASLIQHNVEGERDDLKSRLAALVHDYSYWDEAYRSVYLDPDSAWLQENYAPYVKDNFGVSGVFLVYADGRVLQNVEGALNAFAASQPEQTVFIGSLRDLAARARNGVLDGGDPVVAASFVRFEGEVATVAASLILPSEGTETPKDQRVDRNLVPVLVFVQPVSVDWINTLQKRLSLRHIGLYPVNATVNIRSLHPADALHPNAGADDRDPHEAPVGVVFDDIQGVPLARLDMVAPDIAPPLWSAPFTIGAVLSAALMIMISMLLRQALMASRRARDQTDSLRLEVMQREHAERELQEHKERLEQIVRERSQSLTRELNRTNALLRDLEAALERVQQVVDTAREGFVQIDLNGRVVGCNQSAQRILGYDARELIGRPLETLISADSLPLMQEQLRLRRSSQYRTYFVDIRTKDGSIIPIEVSAANEYENGILKGSVGFFRDLRLEQQQSKALDVALAEAKDGKQGKAAFITDMGQVLRTPLNAILGYAQMLLGAGSAALPPRQQDQVRRIHQAGETVLALINESVDLVRVESGAMVLSVEPVSANTIVEEALRLAAVLAEQMSVSLVARHYQPQGRETQVMVRADPGRLRQVLLNLISNGIKYNHPGGEVSISIGITKTNFVRFEVADSGIGIPEPLQATLFLPFTRLGQERTQIQGCGLGLAVTRTLVIAMGGEISLESEEGKGSRFRVDIPQSLTVGERGMEKG
jgi:PAS domain S-box-containing protein